MYGTEGGRWLQSMWLCLVENGQAIYKLCLLATLQYNKLCIVIGEICQMFVVLVLVVCNVRFRCLSVASQISVSYVLDIITNYVFYNAILYYLKYVYSDEQYEFVFSVVFCFGYSSKLLSSNMLFYILLYSCGFYHNCSLF